MNATIELLELYEQWKNLTEREGAAIFASDWTEVRRCQQGKQKLQPQIIKATDRARNVSREAGEFEPRLRECINELIRLENNNSASLQIRIEAAKQDKNDLERTSSRLRQIHKSYVPAPGPIWNQYT